MNKILEQIVSEFECFIGEAPDVIPEYQNKTCFVCGQPFNKSNQVEELKKLFITSCEKYHQEKMKELVESIPKEKPMNVFSFVLRGEELERYMKHKGFNDCLSQVKDLLK